MPVRVKPSPLPRQKSRLALVAVAGCVAAAMLVLPLALLLDGPGFVRRMTIVNTTPYELTAHVSGPSGDEWVDLGSVSAGRERSFEQVIDQGDRWTFRFTLAGVEAGQLEVPRSDLASQRWVVTVPPGFAVPLEAAGLGHSPS